MKNNYIKKTLSNNVKLYLYLDKNMKQSFVSYTIDYGSSGKWFDFYLDDKQYHVVPGCAHFLEHLLGEHSKYGDLYEYLSKKNYFKNGITSQNSTTYFFRGTNDILESIEKLINIIDDPVFTKEDVEKTREAIIEETKGPLNDKRRVLLAILQKNAYKDLNLYDETLSTIGNKETTKKIDYNMLKICYDAFYYDENKTLLIAGNYDEKEITEYVENIYRSLPQHKKRVKEYTYKNLDKIENKYTEYNMNINEQLFGITLKEQIKNLSKIKIKYYFEYIMDSIFDDSSEFIQKLKKDNILINYESSILEFIDNKNYIINIIASVKNPDEFKKELIKEIKTNKYDKKSFDLFIRQEISYQALKMDDKYNLFKYFYHSKNISDNFNDIDVLKTLSFEEFEEYNKELNLDDYIIGIIKEK